MRSGDPVVVKITMCTDIVTEHLCEQPYPPLPQLGVTCPDCRSHEARHVSLSCLAKTLGCPSVTGMEKVCPVVREDPDERVFRVSCRLSKESSCVEYRMHRKVCIIRACIEVLQCLPNVADDVQPLRAFFLNFSDKGLLWRLACFNAASR
jgi:hypothetical protein